MELFSLFGTISLKYADAVEEIDKVAQSAKDAGEELNGMGASAEQAKDPIEDTGESAGKADDKFSAWSLTLSNLIARGIEKVIGKCTQLAESVIDLGTDFTAAMSEVQAISGASNEELAALEQTARDFGASTVFSANDAAQALKYMSLAGWSAKESTSALGGVLDLAAASGMELAKASDMVTDYLSAFGMGADQAAYFADMLAAAQSGSNTTAEQLGDAYRNCAANLNAAGQDVETVTAMLEAMANQGYKGSEAGTALAAIMRDITNAMEDGKITIGDTSVSVMDASGNFLDLTDILTHVEAATYGMGDAQRAVALSAAFTADSTKGLNLLLNEGFDNIAQYEEALRGAKGAACDMAAVMNDNLKGDLADMHSAFDELKLKIFDGAESPLRGLVQFVTDSVVPMLTNLVDNFNKIAPVLAGLTTALVTCKAAMMISGVVNTLVKSFKAYTVAHEGATVAQWLFNTALAACPAVLIVSLIAGLIAALVALWNTNEDFRNGVTAAWETVRSAVGTAIEAIIGFFQKAWSFLKSAGDAVGSFFQTVWNAVQVGFLFIAELVRTYIDLISLPWRFIWENCKEYLIAAWNAIQTRVLAALDLIQNIISTVFGFIKNLVITVWNAIVEHIQKKLNFIRTVVITIFTAVRDAVSEKLNAVRERVTAVFENVKSVIGDKLTAAKTTVTDIFENIRSSIEGKIGAARDFVKKAIDTLKGYFNFSWSLPKLKLPHFSITGDFSLNPPSVPSFGIDWYAKGGILTKPTIFDYDPKSNTASVGGEAGAEAVAPIDILLGYIRTAVREENAAAAQKLEAVISLLEQILGRIPSAVVLSTGETVGALAPYMDTALGNISSRDRRG